MGSGKYSEFDTRALATKLISVAELRKDAVAFISPYRGAMISDSSDQEAVQVLSDADITNNVINFFEPVTSSSYAYSIVDISICLIDLLIHLDIFL